MPTFRRTAPLAMSLWPSRSGRMPVPRTLRWLCNKASQKSKVKRQKSKVPSAPAVCMNRSLADTNGEGRAGITDRNTFDFCLLTFDLPFSGSRFESLQFLDERSPLQPKHLGSLVLVPVGKLERAEDEVALVAVDHGFEVQVGFGGLGDRRGHRPIPRMSHRLP